MRETFAVICSNEIQKLQSKIDVIRNVATDDEYKRRFRRTSGLKSRKLASIILRVEFILYGIININRDFNAYRTLKDVQGMFYSPLMPHTSLLSDFSKKAEALIRIWFNEYWSHEALIIDDLNIYFGIEEDFGQDFLHISSCFCSTVDADSLKLPMFSGSDSIMKWRRIEKYKFMSGKREQEFDFNREDIYALLYSETLPHSEAKTRQLVPPEGVLNDFSVNKNIRLCVKGKNGSLYHFREGYLPKVKEQYLKLGESFNPTTLSFTEKEPITVDIEELRKFAKEADSVIKGKNFGERIEVIEYLDVQNDFSSAKVLSIQGTSSWVGLPNAGKSTVIQVLSAYLSLKMGKKSALVLKDIADVNEAVSTLKALGVKAVPLIGNRNHDESMMKYLSSISEETAADIENIANDNMMDYYSRSCRLKAILSLVADIDENSLCYSIAAYDAIGVRSDYSLDSNKRYVCPYILECEYHKSRQEADSADVVVTNFHAFVKSTTERVIFGGSTTLLEYISGKCDVIFADEADLMQDVDDSTFTDEELIIEGYEESTFEKLIREVDDNSRGKKATDKSLTLWLRKARAAKGLAEYILTQLAQEGFVPGYMKDHPFTSRTMFRCVVDKLVYKDAVDDEGEVDEIEADANADKIKKKMFSEFDAFIEDYHNYVSQKISISGMKEVNISYINTVQSIISNDVDYERLLDDSFSDFLARHDVDTDKLNEAILKRIRYKRIDKQKSSEAVFEEFQNYKKLFGFSLMIVGFEAHYSYINHRQDLCRDVLDGEDEDVQKSIRTAFLRHYKGLLPQSPGVSQFGLYYSVNESGRKHLLMRKYYNVGRYIVYHLHDMFKSLDGKYSANTVLLSATSYMPCSAKNHIDLEPQYLLRNKDGRYPSLKYVRMPLKDGDRILRLSGVRRDKADTVLRIMAEDMTVRIEGFPAKIERLMNLAAKGRERVVLTFGSISESFIFCKYFKDSLIKNGIKNINPCVIVGKESDIRDKSIDVFFKPNLSKFVEDGRFNVAIVALKSFERGINVLTKGEDGRTVAAFSVLVYMKRPYPVPSSLSSLSNILNSESIKGYGEEPSGDYTVSSFVNSMLKKAAVLESAFYKRSYYTKLEDYERKAIIADLLVATHQVEGRLTRGNVDAVVVFADGAFYPNEASRKGELDTYETSIVLGFHKYFKDAADLGDSDKNIRMKKIIQELYGYRINALDAQSIEML